MTGISSWIFLGISLCFLLVKNMSTLLTAKQQRIDLAHLRAAHAFALSLSKDPSTRVGAIIVSADGRKMSAGYNGMVAGVDETVAMWNDRKLKYPRVVHAEANALLNCPFEKAGCTIYCTLHPCAQCLKQIVQAGVVRVVHYGPIWEREPEPDVVKELVASDLIEMVRYDEDDVIEGILSLFRVNGLAGGVHGRTEPSHRVNDHVMCNHV